MTLFVPKQFDDKLNFCCNEFKFKLNRYICATTIDAKNFAVIKNVAIKSFHCNCYSLLHTNVGLLNFIDDPMI